MFGSGVYAPFAPLRRYGSYVPPEPTPRPRPLRPGRSIGLVALGIAIGLIPTLLRGSHTAVPKRLAGTVIWSNQETQRILFQPDGKPSAQKVYFVAPAYWRDERGQGHGRGYPSCLTAGQAAEPVRTDHRKVEIETIQLSDDEVHTSELAVIVRCLG
jgi:hypothetical protein